MKRHTLKKGIALMLLLILLSLSMAACSGGADENAKVEFIGSGLSESKDYTLKELKELSAQNVYLGSALTSDSADEADKMSQIEGATLVYLLTDIVKLSPDASTVAVCAEDGFRLEYPIKDLYAREESGSPAVLVWSEDGKSFDPDEGQPLYFYDAQDEIWIYNVVSIKVK